MQTLRRLFYILAALWAIASWVGGGMYAERKTNTLITHDSESLESDSLALYQAFEERLNFLSSLPSLIGHFPDIEQAVKRYSHPNAIKQAQPDPKSYWTSRPDLIALNSQLKDLAGEIGVDVIFILNAEGYSVASSNSDTPGSIVGTLLQDRHYYQTAIHGEKGYQYAVGRKTNVAGLYYSAPILVDTELHGAVVVKLDVPNFQNLLMPYNAFLTDNHDVIVLSSNPDFLQHMLPGARFLNLSEERRQFQYKQAEFPILNVENWGGKDHGRLQRLNTLLDPVIMSERNIPGGDLVMHVYQTLPEIKTIHQERIVWSVVASMAGFSVLTLIYQIIIYLLRLRQSKSHAEAETERLNETLSEREQQLDTVLNHLPLMVVARDPLSGKVLDSNLSAQQVLGLQAPLPANLSYDESLPDELATFLSAGDDDVKSGLEDLNTREKSFGNKILQAQSLAARDKNGTPRLLIDLVEDITRRRNDEAEIRRLAFEDTLTGLSNRAAFKLHLDKTVADTVANRRFGSMILIDLDAFKQINDRFGHSLGDKVLKEVAHRLSSETAPGFFPARLASDEFVAIVNSQSTDGDDAKHHVSRVAHSLLRKITQPYLLSSHTLHLTASLGVAFFGPNAAQTGDQLMIQADAAMYEAKRRERGTIQFFDENTQKYLNDQAEMANRLRGAITTNVFKQYYQPQVDHAGKVVGVEALLRWHDHELGEISPAIFVPLAESLHLIVDIDRWVLKEACRVAGKWKADPLLRKVVISVNVSAELFSQNDFIEEVTGYLVQFGGLPGQMMIELTEGSVIEDTEANIMKIRDVHTAGLGMAIDDFGTGNSSLAYLRQFDVDQIKIDQRFVRDMIADKRTLAITTLIINLAHDLGYQTLAEGVETPEQRDLLAKLGCNLFQGFLFGKAVPLTDCEALICQQAHRNIDTHKL